MWPSRLPALVAAEHGVADLFLPLRYGRVELRERMPRRFYCPRPVARGRCPGETHVFDIDFLDSDGQASGRITEFTVKRAPRERIAARARRRRHPAALHGGMA